jgi:hypothetical protein
METKFTEQESFAVINEMIDRARHNIQKGSANQMIYSGYEVAFLALVNFVLLYVLDKPYQSYWIWMGMIPCYFINRLLKLKSNREAVVKTQIDEIVAATWKVFGMATYTYVLLLLWLTFAWKLYNLPMMINPGILLMLAIGQYITAKACRFQPFVYSAIIFWIGAIGCVAGLIFFHSIAIQFIIMAVCMIVGFVVPGHILNKRAKNHV